MKHIIIDNTAPETASILQVTDESRGICWVKLYEAEGRKVIFAPLNGKLLSKLELLAIQYLYWNIFEETPLAELPDLAAAIMPHIESLTIDLTSLAELQWRVELLVVDDNPTIAEHEEDAKLGPMNEAGEHVAGVSQAEMDDAEASAHHRIPDTPKPPTKIPGRPKAGSSTAKVWDIADTVLAENETLGDLKLSLDGKEIRATIIGECESQGINKSTAATQYSKWKRAQKGAN